MFEDKLITSSFSHSTVTMLRLKILIFSLAISLSWGYNYDHLRLFLDPNFRNETIETRNPEPIVPAKCVDLIYDDTPPSMCDKHMQLYVDALSGGTPTTWALRSKFERTLLSRTLLTCTLFRARFTLMLSKHYYSG